MVSLRYFPCQDNRLLEDELNKSCIDLGKMLVEIDRLMILVIVGRRTDERYTLEEK
jgi:hypothetical protein